MKKVFTRKIVLLVFLVSQLSVSLFIPSFAESSDVRFNDVVNDVKNSTINKIELEKYTKEGLNDNDALYYAKVDKIVKSLEMKKISVNLIDENDRNSDKINVMQGFSEDSDDFRQKILNGDKDAWKKALISVAELYSRTDYMNNLVDKFQGSDTYEIVQPDGSKITFRYTKEIEPKMEKDISKLGYSESEFVWDQTYLSPSYKQAEWVFTSGISFSKILLYAE